MNQTRRASAGYSGGGNEIVLIKAAINGNRTRKEHPAIPVTPEQQAGEAAAAVASGAGAIHVHVRDAQGRESLSPEDVAAALDAIRAAVPGTPVGISTGAWIVPEVRRRLSLINAWDVLPDFASVNIHEAGALQVVRLLLDRRVGVEAGIWTAQAAVTLLDSNLAEKCLRILLEPAEGPGNAQENLAQIETVLQGVTRPRLLHGLGASAWKFVMLAAELEYDTRTGFEDTLLLPDGSLARSNAALVDAARQVVAKVKLSVNRLRLLVMDDYEGELAKAPAMERLREHAAVTVLNRPLEAGDRHLLQGFKVLLALRERTAMDSRFFDACPDLELVLQTGGHAYHLDVAAATERGIVVALGRRVTRSRIAVPELVFGFMIGLVRRIYPLAAEMRNGRWPESIGGSLAGRTLGLLGYGRLGRPVARLAEAFGMKVIAWQRGVTPSVDEFGVRRLPLDVVLAESDVISVNLRLSEESRGLLNRERLWKMKPGAILINTSRGAIIDESALVEALQAKRLAGVGLDVFAVEPLPESSPLRTMPNVLLTPHIGWKVTDVLHEFVEIAADQLAQWLDGTLSSHEILNPEAMSIARTRSGALNSD